jgi:hypothetical protein
MGDCLANLVNVDFSFLEWPAQTPDAVRQSLSKIGKADSIHSLHRARGFQASGTSISRRIGVCFALPNNSHDIAAGESAFCQEPDIAHERPSTRTASLISTGVKSRLE